jgi:hypothetical protein
MAGCGLIPNGIREKDGKQSGVYAAVFSADNNSQ